MKCAADLVAETPRGMVVTGVYAAENIKQTIMDLFYTKDNNDAFGVLVLYGGKQYYCTPSDHGYKKRVVQNHPYKVVLDNLTTK